MARRRGGCLRRCQRPRRPRMATIAGEATENVAPHASMVRKANGPLGHQIRHRLNVITLMAPSGLSGAELGRIL